MFCKNCGTEINEDSAFCPKCGTSLKQEEVVAQPTTEQPAKKQGNGMAVAGFVCSFFIPLLGWIFGGIGLSRSKKRNGKGKGLSIAAIVIASVSFVINLIMM